MFTLHYVIEFMYNQMSMMENQYQSMEKFIPLNWSIYTGFHRRRLNFSVGPAFQRIALTSPNINVIVEKVCSYNCTYMLLHQLRLDLLL